MLGRLSGGGRGPAPHSLVSFAGLPPLCPLRSLFHLPQGTTRTLFSQSRRLLWVHPSSMWLTEGVG